MKSIVKLFIIVLAMLALPGKGWSQLTFVNNSDCAVTVSGIYSLSLSPCLLGPYFLSTTISVPPHSAQNIPAIQRNPLIGSEFNNITVVTSLNQSIYLSICTGPTFVAFRDCSNQQAYITFHTSSFASITY